MVSYIMDVAIDPALEAFVGSRTRLLVLAALANAPNPLTGYRVAKITDLPRTKVYSELNRAFASGLVGRADDAYFLGDADLRTLLRRRVRIVWFDDLVDVKEKAKAEMYDVARRLESFPPPRLARTPGFLSNPADMPARAKRKDQVLREAGLRPSSHG